jgi:hypothetical protein
MPLISEDTIKLLDLWCRDQDIRAVKRFYFILRFIEKINKSF